MAEPTTAPAPATDPAADPATEPQTDPATDPTTDPATEPDDGLGDAGKKALKTERDARKAAEKERDTLKAEVTRLQRSNAAVKGTDLEAIKTEIRAEFTAQIAETSIKAEAKGRLQDPADALLYIKPTEVSGEEAIKAAVDQLLKDKPYLAAESGAKPWGDVGGGKTPSAEPEPATPEERMRRAYGKAGK
jgi:predicted Zn-dependent protease